MSNWLEKSLHLVSKVQISCFYNSFTYNYRDEMRTFCIHVCALSELLAQTGKFVTEVRIFQNFSVKSQKIVTTLPQNMVRKKFEFSIFKLESKCGSTGYEIHISLSIRWKIALKSMDFQSKLKLLLKGWQYTVPTKPLFNKLPAEWLFTSNIPIW